MSHHKRSFDLMYIDDHIEDYEGIDLNAILGVSKVPDSRKFGETEPAKIQAIQNLCRA